MQSYYYLIYSKTSLVDHVLLLLNDRVCIFLSLSGLLVLTVNLILRAVSFHPALVSIKTFLECLSGLSFSHR